MRLFSEESLSALLRGSVGVTRKRDQFCLNNSGCAHPTGFFYTYGFSWWMSFLCPMLLGGSVGNFILVRHISKLVTNDIEVGGSLGMCRG